MRIALIVARADNGVIGREGELPWRLPGDMKFFKAVTMGKPIVMGRKTFQSIGRPLPGRTNIVVTRDAAFSVEGVEVACGIDAALDLARRVAEGTGTEEVMVIGGGQIYAETLPRADRIYLTEVRAAPEGDARFPSLDPSDWQEASREHREAEADAPAYDLVVLDRRRPA